jgi:muramidase (phage lysozyme)
MEQTKTVTPARLNPDSVLLKKIRLKVIRLEKGIVKTFGDQVTEEKKKSNRKRTLSIALAEEKLEKKKPRLNLRGLGSNIAPKTGLVNNIVNFLIFSLFGRIFTMTQKILPKLTGLIGMLKIASNIIGWFTSFIIDSIVVFIDGGYKIYDNIVGKSKEIKQQPFRQVANNFSNVFNNTLLATADFINLITGQFSDSEKVAKNTKETKPKGAAVGGPVGTTRGNIPVNKPITRELKAARLPTKPRKDQVQKTRVGKDVGGEGNVRAFYGSPKIGIGGIIGIFRPSNITPKKTPVDSISTVSSTLRSQNGLFGDIASVGSDVALGQKPEKSVYRNTAKDVVYLAQIIASRKENKMKDSLLGMAYGGTVPSSIRTISSQADMIDLVEVIIRKSVEERVNTALGEIKGPMVRRASEINQTRKSGYFDPTKDTFWDNFRGLGGGVYDSQGPGEMGGADYQSIATYGTPEEKALLDAISFAEGTTKSYGTISGGDINRDLEAGKLTVQQVINLGNTFGRPGSKHKISGATGRYQFMPSTLTMLLEKGVLKPNEKFTPQVQDRAAIYLMRSRGVTPDMLKKEGLSQRVSDLLAPEWASFPYSLKGGRSYYGQPNKPIDNLKNIYTRSLQGQLKEQQIESIGGGFRTGLKTGPRGRIGRGTEYHVDARMISELSLNDKISMIDSMAAAHAKEGFVMEFSGRGVKGVRWDISMSKKEKERLATMVLSSHHEPRKGWQPFDYYIVRRSAKDRWDKSAEGANIMAPRLPGGTYEYQEDGGYGRFLIIRDKKGRIIFKVGHGDVGLPSPKEMGKQFRMEELPEDRRMEGDDKGKTRKDKKLKITPKDTDMKREQPPNSPKNPKESRTKPTTNKNKPTEPQKSWYDPRGWFGKKRGGIIGQTPSIPTGYTSYERYGGTSILAIQPMIIHQPVSINESSIVPVPFPIASGVNNMSDYRA